MPTPVDTAKAYVAELTKLGIRATYDPRKVVAPCVLLVPPTVDLNTNCGGSASWTAFALAATGAGNSDAWTQIDTLVAKALEVLPAERVEPAEYALEDNPSNYPAYALTWTGQVEFTTP